MDLNTVFFTLSLLVLVVFSAIKILENNKINFTGRTLTELMIIANEQYTSSDKVVLFAKVLESIDWSSVDPLQKELLLEKLQNIINILNKN